MKRLFIPFMFIACLIMAACSNEEPGLNLTPDYLEATTWDAELTGTASPIPTPIAAHFVIQFTSKESGKCIPAYDDNTYDGLFTYSINKDMILFNGSLTGYWSLIERTDNKMVLQSFQPKEFNLVLTKK